MAQARGKIGDLFPQALSPQKLAHIVIRTPNFEASKQWYADVLGAAPAYENPQLSFMTYDDEHHRVGIISMPDLKPTNPEHAGMEHFAFTFEDLGALLATYTRLKALGITPFWTINHGPTISFYYKDPDANKVELQYDVFPTVEAVKAFFDSGKYDENFMGINFDADQMVRDFEDGVPLEVITERPPLPPGMSPWDMLKV